MKLSKMLIVIAVITVVLGLFVYYCFDPLESVLFPKCPFLVFTGYKCPGCGTQRALHCLLHFNFREAVGYNAFMVFSLPLLLFLIIADIQRNRWPRLYLYSRNPILSWAVLAAVLLWWCLRNVFSV